MISGDLVISDKFIGIGKVLKKNLKSKDVTVAFFESPMRPYSNILQIISKSLKKFILYEEAVVYCIDQKTGIWCRCRYAGEGPEDRQHYVIFRQGESAVVSIDDICILNLAPQTPLNPSEFLASRANDAPFFFPLRHDFVTAYLEQRKSCRSISSLPSSSVELERHQLAVVRRVLMDPTQKYLLADEVGLGKTIEACLIIREHILEKKRDARVVIAVPESLIGQWRQELTDRFFLGDLLVKRTGDAPQIKICAHEDLLSVICDTWQPTLLTVDEAHQVAQLAWSGRPQQKELFAEYARLTDTATVALLLSGTPLNGNEKNFLAMLHCLNPRAYSLDEKGVEQFLRRIEERERLGGLYGALTPATPNASLENILDELSGLFSADAQLLEMIEKTRPLVDFFAPQEGEERRGTILTLRRYIGENYRLHQRLLRNRRENNDLEVLFPGLAGLTKHHWPVDIYELTLDELIDEYRSQASANPDLFEAMCIEGCLPWIDDLLTSPVSVGQRAKNIVATKGGTISEQERNILIQIIEVAKKEQEEKDLLLIRELKQWLYKHRDGKAVVFCTREDVALELYNLLRDSFADEIALYKGGDVKAFISPESKLRVLLCDQRGEDGLNLHGGNRLAVHYSLPRDFSRIEQRLGRFNRYSANLFGVKPVQSMVLLPERVGITGHWVALLDDSMHVFSTTLASLQYMLEEQLDLTWHEFSREGCSAFTKSAERFEGEGGLITTEFKRVRAQEELMSMEAEVEEAFEFAEQLEVADEVAEEQVKRLTSWITNALQFRQFGKRGDGFRFQFVLNPTRGGRTLVDAHSFISTCLLGFDFNGGYPPVTMGMSASRTEVSDGRGLYPFRYGQPFVDTIWDLLQSDARGASMAFLRIDPEDQFTEPEVFFSFSWLLTDHEHGVDRVEQRLADERFPPVVETFWLRQDGQPLDADISVFLDTPYKKGHADMNLRSSLWHKLENWFPADQWQRTVMAVTEKANLHCLKKYTDHKVTPHSRLLSTKAVILCNADLFSQMEGN